MICFVCQRYGLEVNGGAELHCRQLAEHMAREYEVEIITTKAVDYVTWKNEYENDVDVINGLTVRRFPVDHPRDNDSFNKLSTKVIGVEHDDEIEEKWFDAQGPYSPKLVDYIREHAGDYDVFIFFTYLYYTSVKGLPEVKDKAIIIPTAHDEPPIYLNYFKKFFTYPSGIFYNTVEEKAFVEGRFKNADILNNGGHGGVGVEIPEGIDFDRFPKEHPDVKDYMVYVGRIDESKGCKQLFEYYDEFKKRNPEYKDFKLVLMGKPVMEVPKRDDIISLGFVDDETKFSGMKHAKFLMLPSQFESLSMVVLESLIMGVPVLVNGRCAVLKGHCVHGNSGLYYTNYYEFESCIKYYCTHDDERLKIGQQGIKYVNDNYRWDVICDRLSKMIKTVGGLE